jgi:hypothetical protein
MVGCRSGEILQNGQVELRDSVVPVLFTMSSEPWLDRDSLSSNTIRLERRL